MLNKKIENLLNEYTLFVSVIIIFTAVKYEVINIEFNYFILTSFVLIALLFGEKFYRESKYLKKLNLKSTANSTMNPTPGKSMLDSIARQGYEPEDIKEIYMMSYSLKHQYLIKSEFANIMKNINFKLHLYSYSEDSAKQDINFIHSFYKDVNIKLLDYHLIEHYNIILMNDDRVFIWYEPDHIVKHQKDILTSGGYLFVSSDIDESKEKFFEIIKQQELEKVA